MKASQFSDAQKAFILKQGDERVCRWRKSSGATPVPPKCGRRSAGRQHWLRSKPDTVWQARPDGQEHSHES